MDPFIPYDTLSNPSHTLTILLDGIFKSITVVGSRSNRRLVANAIGNTNDWRGLAITSLKAYILNDIEELSESDSEEPGQ